MDFGLLAAFWVVSIALVVTPGADWAYTISAGLARGRLLPAVAGMLLGYLFLTAVTAAGVGALIASLAGALIVLTILGAGYLIFLGYRLFRNPPALMQRQCELSRRRNWVARGFAISGLNPKALLLFIALLPQFTSFKVSSPIPVQLALLGLVHIANCGAIYTVVGLTSKTLLTSRPSAAAVVGKTSGIIMIAIGCLLLVEQLWAVFRT